MDLFPEFVSRDWFCGFRCVVDYEWKERFRSV